MPKMHIKKTIDIKAPIEKVYTTLNDFNQWTPWSPWIIMEPETVVTVADDKKSYKWEGDRIGTGQMKVTSEKENAFIDYDLNFLKPWKSYAKVRFEFQPTSDGTRVAWLMDSSLPFFMFFMKKMMEAFVGMDYERGLAMLKDYVEDGEVHSKIDFEGEKHYPGCQYIGIKTTCSLDDIGPKMEADFKKLEAFVNEQPDLVADVPFSIYHKWDPVKRKTVYTSGIPVKNIPSQLPAGMVTGKIPATRVHSVKHTGPYEHLGNAWGTMYNMQRSKTFKMNKKIDPFETYANDPSNTPANELVTEVHFAVK